MHNFSTSDFSSPAPVLQQAARDLAHSGLQVHPLHGKAAYLKDYPHRATTEPAQIDVWWQQAPTANVGYVVAADMLVLDVDPRHGGLASLAALEKRHGALPDTWKVITGRGDGGFHLLYTLRPGWKDPLPYVSDIAPGVQVLGHLHNVVGVGSIHPETGQPYVWNAHWNPATMPERPYAPAWLPALAFDSHRTKGTPPREAPSPAVTQVSERDRPDTCVTPTQPSPTSRIAAQLRDPAHLPALLGALGYAGDLRDGAAVQCPCPRHSHGDQHPSGTLREPKGATKDFGVWCWVAQEFYPLTMVYHMQHGEGLLSVRREHTQDGRVSEHRMLFLLWGIRFLKAAGLLHPTLLGAPSLPQDAPGDAHALWQVVLDMKAHRAVVQAVGAPVPLSYRFLRDWSVTVRLWSVARLRTAFNWLIGKGWIRFADKVGHGLMATVLWSLALTADRALRRVCRAIPVLKTQDANLAQVAATEQTLPTPPACTACGNTDAWETTGACSLCIAMAVNARLEEKRRLHGRPVLVELSP